MEKVKVGNFKEDTKMLREITNNLTKKCPNCGHSLGFKTRGLEKATCNWCGTLVFKSDKAKRDWDFRKFKCALIKGIRKANEED